MIEGGHENLPTDSPESPTSPTSASILYSRGTIRFAVTLVSAAVLFVFVRTFVVEAYRIPTGSMENTLLVGDFLLVNKAVYGTRIPGTELRLAAFREPALGDVVVFHPPHEPGRNYVKRVVGIPHDTLEMRDKRLYRNGSLVEEPWAKHDDDRGDSVHPNMRWQSNFLIASSRRKYQPTRDNWGPIVVPSERYFVLGDNRDNSEDSRYWGFVEREEIRGQPWRVYYSFVQSTNAADPDAPRAGAPWLNRVRWSRIGEPIG